jgi:hypothetical protein
MPAWVEPSGCAGGDSCCGDEAKGSVLVSRLFALGLILLHERFGRHESIGGLRLPQLKLSAVSKVVVRPKGKLEIRRLNCAMAVETG